MTEMKEVKAMTPKEFKAKSKPKFAANFEEYYPVNTLRKYGFERHECPICHEHYWSTATTRVKTCGDSNCEGKYKFIGTGCGIGAKGHKITIDEAWKTYEKALTSTEIPATAIKRYPVVARWRNDVDFVAAGIYCFQPYCVTGQLEPPANPLICPQFCLRFNDLDNIGISGRHFSGFIMIGLQVFNSPQKYVYFKEECVDYNLRWLTKELEIELDDITLIEDVWCGGGNLGPSIEMFVKGLEVGNMVFTQYKILDFVKGEFEPLKHQVIDVGIGLERIPWLINGTPTSYLEAFPGAVKYLQSKLGVTLESDVISKFAPYCCLLNLDECKDVNKAWADIAKECGVENREVLQKAIQPARDLYIIADHSRTMLIAIYDGALPSAVGGGANLRNIVRRMFSILAKNGWWEKLGGMDGLMELFECHKKDLEKIYGKFDEYKSFRKIIEMEYQRWCTTDIESQQKVQTLLKKKKGVLTVDDWIFAMKSYGLSPDKINEISKLPIPDNLYTKLAELEDQRVKMLPTELYETADIPETKELFYENGDLREFNSEIVSILEKVDEKGKGTGVHNLVILKESAFYPIGGGQDNDTGKIKIDGVIYDVTYVEKVGKCILHHINSDLKNWNELKGQVVTGYVDDQRRNQLRAHHTATHIIHQAAHQVLGPHVWQNGAKKTVEEAHLDITHFSSITREEENAIEKLANEMIRKSLKINKFVLSKEEAEKRYGFSLYQGGVVAGNEVRIVDISGYDTEACCGTHCDNTSQVGLIRIIKTNRISDGVVRIRFVAGDAAYKNMAMEKNLINDLCDSYSVLPEVLQPTLERIFTDYKKLTKQSSKMIGEIFNLYMRVILDEKNKMVFASIPGATQTTCVSFIPQHAPEFKKAGKSVLVLAEGMIYALVNTSDFKAEELKEILEKSKVSKRKQEKKEEGKEEKKEKSVPFRISPLKVKVKGKKPEVIEGYVEVTGSIGGNVTLVTDFLKKAGFIEFQL
ncbi:alanine--tRNA ligase, putative [Entamoeba histolytica HM-1:IMSS-B]|uniref:Alanine--tRNA ligase n=6 Tax=Entamoeba histolytica TaxID=5759 RepID=C4LWS5_ENTH1|nr:alanyl-tRNA synthetase, putative [Entamoeba histolytica HM-1:IMSS]EMD44750.1 alanyltRNA synthetase, putative [Entamoeba histolytica KU27]EMH72907.1 alanine--tRNA ligase, putative [Entamoeba histolytica HM-1:IMSS-B]EMS16262.1 alanyl-tRNA synthetase [Entamoeba histolytica HM-3:IMSS]ENY62204.1 alanyl-tRNA synthetase, putative [Entamoeba histolytica HM-1:IMSS-A]GAT93167.1 alanyl-tRNA synthetase putative [Entamoeba histolytica]|eukprot:XP_654998.1 alanyl-tRNA synthetase, putative [Entamoeba histolytica HM-1:IMSS]